MNNDIVRQTLLDSFNVIKDSWETKNESIINAIDAMTAYDIDLAMEMWCYVLSKNKKLLRTDAEKFVKDVIEKMANRHQYYRWNNGYDDFSRCCRTIGAAILKNDNLCSLIYGSSLDYGGCSNSIWGFPSMSHVPTMWIYAYLLTTSEVSKVYNLTKLIISNKYTKDFSASSFIRKAVQLLIEYYRTEDDEQVSISEDVKMALMESVDSIQDSEQRAELVISILSLK